MIPTVRGHPDDGEKLVLVGYAEGVVIVRRPGGAAFATTAALWASWPVFGRPLEGKVGDLAGRLNGAKKPSTDALLNTLETARFLKVSESTLRKWRMVKDSGPAFIQLGRAIRYRPADLEAFIEKGLSNA